MGIPYPEAAIRAEVTETRKRQVLHDLCLISVGAQVAHPNSPADVQAKNVQELYEALARVVERKFK